MSAKYENSVVEYLRTIDTPTLSNAIERLGLRPKTMGFAPVTVRCIFPELGRMCGYAVTAHVETMTDAHQTSEEPFIELFEAVEQSRKPAVVAFQELGGHVHCATHCGEVMATIFKRLGAIGLLSDCAVRDIPEVRKLRFHYFARGAVASHANFRIVRVGVPIHVHGLVVHPGDLLHGDENGLIQVPAEAVQGVETLREAVEKVRTGERALMDFVAAPTFTVGQLRGRFLE